jgi:hypothetical protein
MRKFSRIQTQDILSSPSKKTNKVSAARSKLLVCLALPGLAMLLATADEVIE